MSLYFNEFKTLLEVQYLTKNKPDVLFRLLYKVTEKISQIGNTPINDKYEIFICEDIIPYFVDNTKMWTYICGCRNNRNQLCSLIDKSALVYYDAHIYDSIKPVIINNMENILYRLYDTTNAFNGKYTNNINLKRLVPSTLNF